MFEISCFIDNIYSTKFNFPGTYDSKFYKIVNLFDVYYDEACVLMNSHIITNEDNTDLCAIHVELWLDLQILNDKLMKISKLLR